MRPERTSRYILAITRSKAKMYEYDVPLEHHIQLSHPPDILFSLAVGLLGDAAAAIADMSTDARREETPPEAIAFAGTYFDAYLQSRLENFAEGEFPILASACFYLADNPGSSKVLANQATEPPPHLGSGLALLTYKLLGGDYSDMPDCPYADAANNVLAQLSGYFAGTGASEGVIEAASAIRAEAYETGDGRELLYADISAAILRRKIAAAAATILPGASGLPLGSWLPFLSRPDFPRELWPSQRRICGAGVLSGTSALIQMPTSAGKTRATELILRSGFLSDRFSLAVIVCPFRSLCHDIRGDMAQAFAADNVAINEATDSFQADLSIEELWATKTILIVTPEKLLYLLRRTPELAATIGLVIYDEGHQFDSGARGVTYELLLTSLKLMLAPNTQIVLISAVIANAARISEWLLGNSELVVDGTGLLPTSRSIAFTTWRNPLGALEYVNPLDPDDREFFVPRVIEAVTLPALPRERTPRVFPKAEDGPSVGLYLGLKLVSKGSVALFCGRKDTAAKICEDAAAMSARGMDLTGPAAVSDHNEVAKIAALFGRQMGAAAAVTRSAALGIFPHHASVPHGLRLSIEFAMKGSLIKFVVCTSTLAQGVNLPIKYLIVTSVNQGKDRILVRDFHNLIGRAGRAGMHAEGSVIFADNAVFDKKAQRRERWRWLGAKELLDAANSEPSASSISEIFQPFVYGRLPGQSVSVDVGQLHQLLFSDDEQTLNALAQAARTADPNVKVRDFIRFLQERARIVHGIASFLLAHLDFETPGLPERAVELAKNTLGHFLADEAQQLQIEGLFRAVANNLLAGAQTVDVRAALRRSPLAPRSVQALRAWLTANLAALLQAAQAGQLLEVVTPVMLQHNEHGTIAALSDPTIVPHLVEAWVRGDSFETILGMLSVRNVRIGGNSRIPKIEDAVALCEGGFGYEGAMIIATLADLADGLNDVLRDAFKFLQRQMKVGLASAAALGMYEVGFADREIAKDLGALFVNVIDVGTAKAWIRANGQYTREAIAAYPAYFENVLDELLR